MRCPARLLLSLWGIILPISLSVSSEMSCTNHKPSFQPGAMWTTCIGGPWPSDVELELLIPADVTRLTLRGISFANSTFGPIPYRPNLTDYQLRDLVYLNDNREPVRFPLHEFMSEVNRSSTTELALRSIRIETLGENELAGFSGIKALRLIDCDVSEIHPNSFITLGNGLIHNRLVLEILLDRRLTTFPWDTLRPVSAILEIMELSNNPQLEIVSSNEEEFPFLLINLSFLYITNNTRLQNLSRTVIDTVPRDRYGQVQFLRNGNRCDPSLDGQSVLLLETPMGSCGVMSLIDWARASPVANKNLQVTCAAITNNTIIHLEKQGYGGFWREFGEPDCQSYTASAMRCTYYTEKPFGRTQYWAFCGFGSWSSDAELLMLIPLNVTHLHLTSIVFDNSSFRPIPHRLRLTDFDILGLAFRDQNGAFLQFPLQKFLKNVDRSVIRRLGIQSVHMENLRENEFSDYTRLAELRLINCDLDEIHPGSFVSTGSSSQYTRFRLEISSDRRLTRFSWNALGPISTLLQTLVLSKNTELKQVELDIRGVEPGKTPFVLLNLISMDIVGNPGLQNLSTAVMSTVNRPGYQSVWFWQNGNKCDPSLNGLFLLPLETPMGSCDLMPIIEWARAAASAESRSLWVSCAAVTNNRVTYLAKSGYNGFWQVHEEPECESLMPIETTIITSSSTGISTTSTSAISTLPTSSASTTSRSTSVATTSASSASTSVGVTSSSPDTIPTTSTPSESTTATHTSPTFSSSFEMNTTAPAIPASTTMTAAAPELTVGSLPPVTSTDTVLSTTDSASSCSFDAYVIYVVLTLSSVFSLQF